MNKLKTLYNNYMPIIISILFIFLLLTDSKNSQMLVISGLTTWYQHMIPALFPFMLMSAFLLRTGLSYHIAKLLYPFLGKIFSLSLDCIYIIIMGFLCGFPMGASIIADSLSLQKISEKEASLLLSFCNNIGPIYFVAFVTTLCPCYPLYLSMTIMYFIPLIYGLFLRYTRYCDIPKVINDKLKSQNNKFNYAYSLEISVQKSITSILNLGAYMIVFNVLQLPLYNSYYNLSNKNISVLKGLIEINSGITAISEYPSFYPIVYSLFLPFGGACCIFQTYSMIKDTSLSLRSYLIHKLVQTLFCVFLYTLIDMLII